MTENTVVLLIMFGTLALVTALSAALPNLSRPTVPLGVNVPSSRVGDPVVRTALARYRLGCVALGVLAAIATWLTRDDPLLGASWIVLVVVGSFVLYALARRPIQRAKAEQGWYDGAQVRITASVTRSEPRPVRVAWPVHLLALGLNVATLIAVGLTYPALPDPYPVHYDALGRADRFEPKSWAAVLGAPGIALLLTVVIVSVCVLMTRRTEPRLPDGDPARAQAFAVSKGRTMQTTLAWTSVAVALLLAGTTTVQIGRLAQTFLTAITLGGLVATLLPVIWMVVRTARLQADAAAAPAHPGPESPDDDRHWLWGLFYYNTDDPRVMVEKRNGLGLTMNVGHPVGMAVTLLGGVLIVAAATMPLWLTP